MALFETRVVEIGPGAAEFLNEGILVLFGEGCPPELRDVAVIHAPGTVTGEVAAGHVLVIGGAAFEVTAVGEVVNRNLRTLGHLVIKFNARTKPELPGDLCVAGGPLPPLGPGTEIRIEPRADSWPPSR